jgi:hypothetical protein
LRRYSVEEAQQAKDIRRYDLHSAQLTLLPGTTVGQCRLTLSNPC